MSKELKELHDCLSHEIETMRRTGRSNIFHVLWYYETEDASDEVLDLCQAARKAHDAAFLEWQKAHPAEWAAANVFTSAIGDARVSKLKALCGLPDEPVKQEQQRKIKNIEMSKFRGNNEQGK